MTRRILFVLVVFTAVLITGAMVPLALNTTAHERNAFTQDVEGMVRTDAAVAQARLESVAQSGSKAKAYAPLVTILSEAQLNGDRLMILQSRGTVNSAGLQVQESPLIQKGAMPAGNWIQFAQQAARQNAFSSGIHGQSETGGSEFRVKGRIAGFAGDW